MKHVSVLVSADFEMRVSVRQVLEELGFDVFACANASEAKSLVEEYLPHVVVLDRSAAGQGDGFSQCPVLQGWGHCSPHLVILAREITAAEIDSLIVLGVTDCFLFPMTYPVLYRRLKRIQQTLTRTPVYGFDDFGEGSLTGRLEFEGRVLGICETGIALVCDAAAAAPIPDATCVSDIFERIGVPVPSLKLLETRPKANATSGEGAFVSYFQISGWQEDARMKLRRWQRDERLKPQVLARGDS